MRRKEREIQDRQEIFDVLRRCDTVRIGIMGEKYPYVVPVSFGMEVVDDKAVIYFHCARQGMKLDLLAKNNNVCVEGDIFIKIEPTAHGITARYESVIGFGTCNFVEDPEDNRKVFRDMQEIFIDIREKRIDNVAMSILSMGMTNDYEVAIEEGANLVRVGTGIFGPRQYNV